MNYFTISHHELPFDQPQVTAPFYSQPGFVFVGINFCKCQCRLVKLYYINSNSTAPKFQ